MRGIVATCEAQVAWCTRVGRNVLALDEVGLIGQPLTCGAHRPPLVLSLLFGLPLLMGLPLLFLVLPLLLGWELLLSMILHWVLLISPTYSTVMIASASGWFSVFLELGR